MYIVIGGFWPWVVLRSYSRVTGPKYTHGHWSLGPLTLSIPMYAVIGDSGPRSPHGHLLGPVTLDTHMDRRQPWGQPARGRFKNMYELLNIRALKISTSYKNRIFQCMGKIFCAEFQRCPLKFHTKYLTHTLKDVYLIRSWKFKSS